MSEQYIKNCDTLRGFFSSCKTDEDRYKKIIAIGEKLPPFPLSEKREENRVSGCQSTLYLHTKIENGVLVFDIWSDALISKGLAAIAIQIFNYLSPEEVLQGSFDIFQEIGITSSLSPSRANGFANLLVKIKQQAISFITQ